VTERRSACSSRLPAPAPFGLRPSRDGGLRSRVSRLAVDVNGKCLEDAGEPDDSTLSEHPAQGLSGGRAQRNLFAYMGPGSAADFPHFDCFVAPGSHTFASRA